MLYTQKYTNYTLGLMKAEQLMASDPDGRMLTIWEVNIAFTLYSNFVNNTAD